MFNHLIFIMILRWVYVRQWPVLNNRLGWLMFDLIFISFYQMFLLLGLAAPVFVVAAVTDPSKDDLTLLDFTIAVTYLGLVITETVADNQQEEFQNTKKKMIKDGELEEPFKTGFISWGLFSLSRHPNYVAEQFLWIIFYLFSVSASGSLLNITITGPLLLILLFQGSTALSEWITGGKYPGYAKYCDKVPKFLGNFWSLQSSYPAQVTMMESKNDSE